MANTMLMFSQALFLICTRDELNPAPYASNLIVVRESGVMEEVVSLLARMPTHLAILRDSLLHHNVSA